MTPLPQPFRLTLLALAAAPFGVVTAAASPLPRPAVVSAAVRAHGARATVATLLAGDQWNALVTEIGAGDADWIALAPTLAPGTDAATSISLDLVLAHALTVNAPAVLSVLDPTGRSTLGARRVCAMPVLSLSMQQLASYQAAAVEAVAPVRIPALAAARAACLNALTGADAPVAPASQSLAIGGKLPHAHLTRADFREPPVHPAPQGRWSLRAPRVTTRVRITLKRAR